MIIFHCNSCDHKSLSQTIELFSWLRGRMLAANRRSFQGDPRNGNGAINRAQHVAKWTKFEGWTRQSWLQRVIITETEFPTSTFSHCKYCFEISRGRNPRYIALASRGCFRWAVHRQTAQARKPCEVVFCPLLSRKWHCLVQNCAKRLMKRQIKKILISEA